MSPDFNVLTSIRQDPILGGTERDGDQTVPGDTDGQFYLLPLHRDRLVEACKAFARDSKSLQGNLGLINLKRVLEAELAVFARSHDPKTPVKLRLEFTKQGDFCVTASCVPIVSLTALYPQALNQIPMLTSATYRIFLSPMPIRDSLFTAHKTTYRRHYDEQRALLPIPPHSNNGTEVLHEMMLFNDPRGEIMEGTITTPYFLRSGGWITPSRACGGHLGVTRRWALTRSLAKEGVILADDVEIGEIIILSNGVRGFGWGILERI